MFSSRKRNRTLQNQSRDAQLSEFVQTPRYNLEDAPTNTEPNIVVSWWTRLLSAVVSGDIANQDEQYLAHQTSRDYIFNAIGQGSWGALFPLLTIVCSQLIGVEQAGLFSMAFVIATLLLFIAQYGVRTYQVSDLEEQRSFSDYQIQRAATVIVMVITGIIWCLFKGYTEPMFSICTGCLLFRATDGMADVYEGRLQQKDKLYLAGLSQALRCGLSFIVFSLILLITRNLVWASWGMGICALTTLIFVSAPLALLETDKSAKARLQNIKEIFVQCWPLFLALFLYNLIDSLPKFAMEGALSYSNQLYFNALYFPAHTSLMISTLIYRPQLYKLAHLLEASIHSPGNKRRFTLLVLALFGAIIAITIGMAVFVEFIGIPLNSFMYGVDFEQYRGLARIMVATGGLCAAIDFLYQLITILRAQKLVTRAYLLSFIISIPVIWMMVDFTGLNGAVIGSFSSMLILFLLLVSEYTIMLLKH